jgi:ubiquitin-conjugating enzyme E2 Q
VQFRFAQGAPDKEKRFIECVREQTQKTGTKYPTLFAWHGSHIGNWHCIIRQGLHYDEILNARAFGNGIYMSSNANTSIVYSFSHSSLSTPKWKSSTLKVNKVLSLQEVVNNTKAFVSCSPHYVVGNIDWVQTRYLFIKGKETTPPPSGTVATVYEQDPTRVVFNEVIMPLSIPITAISKSLRPGNSIETAVNPQAKRSKTVCQTDQATAERREDDADSVVSDAGDLAWIQEAVRTNALTLRESETHFESGPTPSKKRSAETATETDLVAGTLDTAGIKFMREPKDATPIATKGLMRLLQEAQKTQENAAPAELGWYIDRNLVNNLYQWIVELHSFPKELPLAKDMKKEGLTSIVLEMRFTSQYPYSPPFVRVVKPRFLGFHQGGGGNVTDGGAMCMEVLTNNGWTVGLTIESLLLQVRLVISDTERPARLTPQSPYRQSTYGIGEAVVAYVRACLVHEWTVPDGFTTLHDEPEFV